jgi:hypothetical protein
LAYVCWAHDPTDLLHRVEIRTQATVHGKDLLVNDCRDRQAIEAVRERLPQLDVVPPLAFIVKAIDTIDGCTFMVSTENEEILWIFDLVCQEQAYCLKRLFASIHVIAKEEVVCLGWEAAVLEQAQKIIVLAMDIAADLGEN